MKVESLIERVRQRYASASRYSDRGTALLTVGPNEMRITFETSFERPDRFSFAFTARTEPSATTPVDEYSYRVDRAGAVLTFEGAIPPLADKPSSLGLAIAAMTGVSFGCAHTIPRLLMPDLIDGRELFAFESRALGDVVDIDGESHHALYLREGALLILVFINEATLVVRRTEGPHPVTVTDYAAALSPGPEQGDEGAPR
jgi:hypothetical protein